MKLLRIALSALATFFPSFSFPQNQSQPVEIHEEVQVNVVDVYITAIDSHGVFVTDLKPEELILREDRIPQEISDFSLISEATKEPLTVSVLIDTSVSMKEKYKEVSKMTMAKNGALLLLSQLKPQDRMLLVTFSETPLEAIGLISNKKLMEQSVNSLKTDYGRTALLDAIHLVVEKVKGEWGRKVIFICSDGQDNASVLRSDKLLEELKDSPDISIIVLGTTAFESKIKWWGEEEELRKGKQLLQSLADTTGGYAYFPKNLTDLDLVMEKLRQVVPSQYFLGYHPSNWRMDGSWRSIEILCKRAGVKLRYRNGYYAK